METLAHQTVSLCVQEDSDVHCCLTVYSFQKIIFFLLDHGLLIFQKDCPGHNPVQGWVMEEQPCVQTASTFPHTLLAACTPRSPLNCDTQTHTVS